MSEDNWFYEPPAFLKLLGCNGFDYDEGSDAVIMHFDVSKEFAHTGGTIIQGGFITAMLAIREEIRAIERGDSDAENNPLKHAPHTVNALIGDWDRPYSREQGCFPPGSFRVDKYWPPVGRVDNVYGDRHLVCTCPPLEDYVEG